MSKLTEAQCRAAMDQAMKAFKGGIDSVPPIMRTEYTTCMATLALSLATGMIGREGMRSFLNEAIESLDDPQTLVIRVPS